jgi:sporulation protein YlmC with PRC-barrel domain
MRWSGRARCAAASVFDPERRPVIRLSQLVGQRVLAADSGLLLGSVRRLLVEPVGPSVALAQVDGAADGQPSVVEWSAVAGIGPDALMVERADAVRPPAAEHEQRLVQGKLEITGKLVLDESGDALGPLEDLEFDERSGRLLRLHVPGHSVEVDRFIALGPDALIVPAQTD